MGAATVWVKPLSGSWQAIGTATDAGIWHEGLVPVSNQWGPLSCTFTLKRQRRAMFPDLIARTPVKVEVAGVCVWRGRIRDTPEQSGAARQITVQCVGGQAKLDDDTLERVLVHTKLADYKDTRGQLSGTLTRHTQAGQVTSDNGLIQIGWAQGAGLTGTDNRVGVVLDLGPVNTAKRVVVTWESSNNSAGVTFLARGTASGDSEPGDDAFTFALNTGASGTSAGTFTTARRYVHLFLYYSGAATTVSADTWVRIKTCQVFADTAYESANASILDAGTIIRDALTRATVGLHTDWSGIGAPSFAFPDFAPDQPRSPRELIAAANAPISQWFFKIDEQLRPLYRARSTVPVIELGSWLGAEGDSGSSNSDEGIVTKVVVRGKGADGAPIRSTRTQTGTIIDRQGDVVAKTVDTSYMLNSTFADQLGDAYLTSHRVSPFKGQNVVGLTGARRVTGGGTVHPAHLLLLTGELARRTDLIDPDTGALGRTAVIDQVTYRDDDGTADVDLDNTRRDFEALQERMGLLVPS